MSNLPTQSQNYTTPSGVGSDRTFSLKLSCAKNKLEEHYGEIVTTELPTPSFRSEMQARVQVITGALRPGDQRLMGAAILEMLGKFLNARPADPAKTAAAFVMEVQNLPLFAVEKACRDISGGRVADLNPDFPPSAAR